MKYTKSSLPKWEFAKSTVTFTVVFREIIKIFRFEKICMLMIGIVHTNVCELTHSN